MDALAQYAARANAEQIRKRLQAEQMGLLSDDEDDSAPLTPAAPAPAQTPTAPSAQKNQVPDEEPDFVYPEQETSQQYELHRRERAKAMIRANAILTQIAEQGAPAHVVDTRRKAYESMIDARFPEIKKFDESLPAKEIFNELPSFTKKDDMIRNIRGELEAASKLTDPKEKAARIRTIVPKLVQSTGTGGADALQPAEVVLGSPEMTNYLGWARSVGSDPSSPLTLAAFLTDSAQKQSQIFEADPDSYIKKIKGIYNNFVNTRDEKIKQLERMSSPSWLKRNTGLRSFKRFDDADNVAAQAPLSQATRVAVEGGASSLPTGIPQAAPAQGQPGQTPRQRIKFVYDSSGKLVPQQ